MGLAALGVDFGPRARVFLVATCEPAIEDDWRSALESEHRVRAVSPGLPDLRNLTRTPATVGRDRLFAAWGALLRHPAGALVVDAGTALTVDAVRGVGEATEGASRGVAAEFLGGAIAPGPGILATALSAGGARLPDFEVSPSADALGRDTEGALAAGVRHGFLGAARELVAAISAEAGMEDSPIVVTGGAAPFLGGAVGEVTAEASSVPFIDGAGRSRRTTWDPLLVHRGLLAAGLDSLGLASEGDAP